MLPSTVTVRSCALTEKSSSAGFIDRNCLVLSATLLKQWRVPRTFNFACLLTNSRASSTELAVYKFSVPYSKLPAQFFNLMSGSSFISGETNGAAAVPEKSLIKILLFMAKGYLRLELYRGKL